MIELSLVGVRVELPSNQPIVLLKETQGERYLPIWIGAVEATAIAFALQGVETPRPMTHDLLRDILQESDIEVERIVINELVEQTFFAMIRMTTEGRSKEVSSRPSDAIALAVRINAPIFADRGRPRAGRHRATGRRGDRGREVQGVPGPGDPRGFRHRPGLTSRPLRDGCR